MKLATDEVSPIEAVPKLDLNERYFRTHHLLNDLQGRALRGGVVTLGGQAINFLLGMASTVILARLLVPRDYGLIAMVTSITGFIALFKDLGLSNATIQRLEITHAQVSFLFWVNCALSLAIALVVAAAAPVIAWFFHEPRLVWITLLLSTNFVFSGLTVQHQALLRRQMQFKTLTVIDAASVATGIAVGVGMALLGCGFWSLVGVRSTTSAVNCMLVWTKCDWRPAKFKRGVGARPMVSFGRNLTGFNLLNYFTRNFDNVLIGRVLGSGPLGFYSKAYGLVLLPISQIAAPLSAVLLTGLSRLQDKPLEFANLFLNALRSLTLVSVPIVVFSFFFAPDVVLVLLGQRWGRVAPVFQLLAPAAVLGTIGFVPHWLCQSLGRTSRQLRYGLVAAPISVAGFLIGIRWGIEGVAASFSLTFVVLFLGYVWYATKGSPVKCSKVAAGFLSAFGPAFVAGLIVWSLRRSLALNVPPLIILSSCAVLFALLYFAVAMLSSTNRTLMFAGASALRERMRS